MKTIIEPFRIKVVEPITMIPRRVYTQSHLDYVVEAAGPFSMAVRISVVCG